MNFDFTLQKYSELCEAISESDYRILTMEEYVRLSVKPEKYIIMRHDIDSEPYYALKMATIENEFGLRSSYYFRFIEGIFLPDLINLIASMGHEIGYHYEVLDKAKGNEELAIKIFKNELTEFNKIYDVKTIAQHGSPLLGSLNATSVSGIFNILKALVQKREIFTYWKNIDMWKKYDFNEFNIIGEAYLSVDYEKTIYLSDTGRSWDSSKYKMKDLIDSSKKSNFSERINNTNDLIKVIKNQNIDRMCILVHPNQWKDSFLEWFNWLIFVQIRNNGKLVLKFLLNNKKITQE
ncbi:MAG: hypothetical protein L6282_06370 [Candidatus Methanoperedenaceae archaeon]|nr:hypothetical protein [Candidatus Methanoperedenaceae archaeon]